MQPAGCTRSRLHYLVVQPAGCTRSRLHLSVQPAVCTRSRLHDPGNPNVCIRCPYHPYCWVHPASGRPPAGHRQDAACQYPPEMRPPGYIANCGWNSQPPPRRRLAFRGKITSLLTRARGHFSAKMTKIEEKSPFGDFSLIFIILTAIVHFKGHFAKYRDFGPAKAGPKSAILATF